LPVLNDLSYVGWAISGMIRTPVNSEEISLKILRKIGTPQQTNLWLGNSWTSLFNEIVTAK